MLVKYSVLFIFPTLVMGDFYNPKYDNFDIQPLIENNRILVSYAKCFLDQGPCTPEAKDFKKVIPEALQTSCGKCNPRQKQLIKRVIRAITDAHPEVWDQLVDKYDKGKKYREAFNEFLREND